MKKGLALFGLLGTGCQVLFPLDPRELTDGGADASTDGPTDGPIDVPPDSARMCALDCPNLFVDLDPPQPFSKYRVIDTQLTFNQAASDCVALDTSMDNSFTHLAVLDDQEELSKLVDLLEGVPGLGPRIGHRRDLANSIEFLPVTDQPHTFPPNAGQPPWASNEPDSSNHCVNIVGDRLNANGCSEMRPYICECDCYAQQ